jgi:hypothetical protein
MFLMNIMFLISLIIRFIHKTHKTHQAHKTHERSLFSNPAARDRSTFSLTHCRAQYIATTLEDHGKTPVPQEGKHCRAQQQLIWKITHLARCLTSALEKLP